MRYVRDGGEADDEGRAAGAAVGGALSKLDAVLHKWVRCARYLLPSLLCLAPRRQAQRFSIASFASGAGAGVSSGDSGNRR